MDKITFSVFRGHPDDYGSPIGEMKEYTVDLDEGMVVLDVIHRIQAEEAPDLACRRTVKRVSVVLVVQRLMVSQD